MIKKILLLAVLCCGATMLYAQKTVDLVKNGKALCEIVIADRPSIDAQFGARELQHHVRLITGATLPIQKASAKRSAPLAILIGENSLSKSLGFYAKKYNGEEYEIKFLPRYIVIAGNEQQSFRKINFTNPMTFPRFFLPEHGALWGVYEFLERFCDVRWYGPGDVGITYTPAKTLSVRKQDLRRTPSMTAFRSVHLPSRHIYGSVQKVTLADHMTFLLRWRLVNRYGASMHNVRSIYLAHWKESPLPKIKAIQKFKGHRKEYFAQGYDGQADRHLNGSRHYFPNDPDVPPQVCKTHPEVFQFFAEEAAEARKGKFAPGAYTGYLHATRKMSQIPFYYSIEDDDNHAVCKCARCSKTFTDKGKKRFSYMHFNFAAQIAKKAAKIDPKVNISTLAYGNHQHYPHGLDMPSNLGVQMVLHCANYFHKFYRDEEMKFFNDWTKDSMEGKRLVSIWAHFLAPCWDAKFIGKYKDYFPVFFYREIGKFMQMAIRRKVSGIFVENPLEVGYFMPTTQLELYITMMIAFDGSKNVDTLADEFFPRYYGKAGTPMKKFYEMIRTVTQDINNYPAAYRDPDAYAKRAIRHAFFPEEVNWGVLGTKERMAQLERYVKEAEKLVKTPMEKIRFQIFLKGLWEPMKRGRSAYEEKIRFMTRPIPSLTAPKVAPAHGDLKKVNWKKGHLINRFPTLQGFPGSAVRQAEVVHDGKYFYLRYTEKCDPKTLKITKSIWDGDDIELIFSPGRSKPYFHYATAFDGKKYTQGHFATADAVFNRAWDFREKILITQAKDSVSIALAFPLDRILGEKELKEGSVFYMNIYRASPGQTFHCWSPPFKNHFHSLDRLGKITLGK